MLNDRLEYVAPCTREGANAFLKRCSSTTFLKSIVLEVKETNVTAGGQESLQLVLKDSGYYYVVVSVVDDESLSRSSTPSRRKEIMNKVKGFSLKKDADESLTFQMLVHDVHERNIFVHMGTGESPCEFEEYYEKSTSQLSTNKISLDRDTGLFASVHASFFVSETATPSALTVILGSTYGALVDVSVTCCSNESLCQEGKELLLAALESDSDFATDRLRKWRSSAEGVAHIAAADASKHIRKHSYTSALVEEHDSSFSLSTRSSPKNFSPVSRFGSTLRPLVVKGKWFYEYNGPNEPLGRAVLLRGVNLSGNVKLPMSPDSRSHIQVDWGEYKNPEVAAALSFVGRPFPLTEAHEHFSRLRRWGFNCLRFLVTWEAIEHAGPGIYDVEYLDFVEHVVGMAAFYGLYVFIDPHQDVWSRATGGSGAPLWTLTKAGLDLSHIEGSDAAFTHQSSKDPSNFQRMSWPQNYQRFAALHMFTMFWGGNDFAPNYSVDGGIPIQQYLQSHFIDAMLQVVDRVCEMDHVIGFDSFNEPSPGFIGCALDEVLQPVIPPGPVFKPYESMIVASGVERYVGRANRIGMILGRYHANRESRSVWLPDVEDIWRDHGVWTMRKDSTGKESPKLLQPNYFQKFPGTNIEINFFRDYLRPFMILYISKIRDKMPKAILFAEGDGFGEKEFIWGAEDPQGIVNASHWYDGFTLFTSNFNPSMSVDVKTKLPVLGSSRIYSMHYRDINAIDKLPKTPTGEDAVMPTLIGEFGIPYNMNDKYAFRSGDFGMQEKALALYYDLFDALQVHSTQWNYCNDNSNEWGDNWNLEDLSLFSKDQQVLPFHLNPDSGGRAIRGFSRPYVPFVCGTSKLTVFNSKTRVFEHEYVPNSRNFFIGKHEYATEIFVPDIHFLSQRSGVVEFEVQIEGGTVTRRQFPGRHVLYIWADESTISHNKVIRITISAKPFLK